MILTKAICKHCPQEISTSKALVCQPIIPARIVHMLSDHQLFCHLKLKASLKYVLLNRAHTLHGLDIQTFEPVLVKDCTISSHPLVLKRFIEDLNGDHVLLFCKVQAETYLLVIPYEYHVSFSWLSHFRTNSNE